MATELTNSELVLAGVAILTTFAAFTIVFWARWIKWKKRGTLFPILPPERILYAESFASGRSLKNWKTKFGGARNCLKIVVTEDELWVTSFFPFVLLADDMDLEHRIKKRCITSVTETKSFRVNSFLIQFRDDAGNLHDLELRPRNVDAFKSALSLRLGNSTLATKQ